LLVLNGNIDVVTRILEFVAESSEELNTCAMISRVFRLSRNDPRFDQTRTGTIIIKTFLANIPREVWQRWDQQVFTGNRVRLVAILTQLQPGTLISEDSDMFSFALPNVREVVLRRHSSVKVPESLLQREHGGIDGAVGFFRKILPNLDTLDIGALAVTAKYLRRLNCPGSALYDSRVRIFRCTAEVVYQGCNFCLDQQPSPFPVNNNLHELHLDPFGVFLRDESPPISAYCQEYSELEQEEWFDDASDSNNGADWVLLREYPNLERVTLKHATYLERYDTKSIFDYWKELPQEALIKFVRQTPKLRWFCSDLTRENIAILRVERSEVEFCN
jgi:hypothetical protein